MIFPGALLPITVGRPSSLALVQSLGENRTLAVVSQLDPRVESPGPEDLYQVGTVCVMHKAIQVPKDNLLLFCEGIARIRTHEFTATEPFLRARVERLPDIEPEITPEIEALRQNVVSLFQQIVAASPNLSDDLSVNAAHITEPGRLADFVAGTLPFLGHTERQHLLEQLDGKTRLNEIHRHLTRELELVELRGRIQSQVQGQLSQNQREFYLREQLKAIQKELGEGDDANRDIEELRKKLEAAGMPEEVKTEAMRELNRLSRMSPASPEYGVTRTYLEWMASLPWTHLLGLAGGCEARRRDSGRRSLRPGKGEGPHSRLPRRAATEARAQRTHPLLRRPARRRQDVARPLHRARPRPQVRAHLHGRHARRSRDPRPPPHLHRRAARARSFRRLRRAGTNDPVFMLDEVDKLGRDFRGDPASALLEVLDPEQNSTFRDNYLDVPFDLSKVLFITTANVLDPVPDALRDRMEIISARRLHRAGEGDHRLPLPGSAADHGERPHRRAGHRIQRRRRALPGAPLHPRSRRAQPGARDRHHLPQAGAPHRRRHAREGGGHARTGGEGSGRAALPHRYRSRRAHRRPGVAVGLAWTPVGGDVLFIEAGRMPGGNKGLIMTGQLGPVMQESVQAALTWVRGNATKYGIDPDLFKTSDIHIHVPAGAIPKDGPSAGITMATALLSMLTDRRVRTNLAMTGEITLTGQVLPVGGIKEKVLAAKRSGVREVILPFENEVNVREDLKSEQIGDIEAALREVDGRSSGPGAGVTISSHTSDTIMPVVRQP